MNCSTNGIWKKITVALMLGLFMVAPQFSQAHEHTMNMSQHKMPAAFEKLKQLVGTWTGSGVMHGKQMDYTVTYELTAGGSAVVEREFAGTPHEMMSVFYPEGNGVVVTHYCMLGNQPHMVLTNSSGNTLTFQMQGNSGIASAQEPHMHGLALTFIDADHIKATWTAYAKGKKSEVTVMDLTKKS